LKEAEYVGILRQKERDQVKNQSELCESLRECQDKLVALEKEVETRRIETREYKEEIGEKDRRIQKLNDQLSTIKSDISNKYIHEIEMYQHQHQELKDRLVDAELRLSRMHKETTSAISGCQTDRERAEERYTSELEAIKARVNKLSEERSKLEKSLRDSETSNASLFDRVG
jgi:chromosome segregation ATPase